jgi:hypothetical protein
MHELCKEKDFEIIPSCDFFPTQMDFQVGLAKGIGLPNLY